MIRLLVDSASDYTQEEIRNKNLYFVPLQIQIKERIIWMVLILIRKRFMRR